MFPTFDALLHGYESGGYFARLVHHPAPHPLRRTPELVYHDTLSLVEPRFTVVMPAFNHESTVYEALSAAALAASLPFDCIVIDDGSEDGTVGRVTAFFESSRPPLLARAMLLRNTVPIYETACDNLGFALARTAIVIELQADIQVREPGFDALFLRAAETQPRPSAISGRCGHTFRWLNRRGPFAALFRPRAHESVGLCGRAIESPERADALKGRVYRCETVNRGPWLVFTRDLERHGYLDERHFFLGNDDHDYHRRLFQSEGRRPLYVPISLSAPLADGAIRRKRTGLNRTVFDMLSAEKRGSPDFHAFMASLGPPLLPAALV
jgi:glycosyltransferase involved in cell wall biosynthesis